MEYRLFTIVRYNYRDYNTHSKPNIHAKIRLLYKYVGEPEWGGRSSAGAV
jgi:hypothetical protein